MTRLHRLQKYLHEPTALMLGLYFLRTLIQFATLTVTTRWLDASGYGAVLAPMALAGMLVHFAGCAAIPLLIREIAWNITPAETACRIALRQILLTLPVLLPIYILTAETLLPNDAGSLAILLLIGFAELGLAPIGEIPSRYFQMTGQLARMSCLVLIQVLLRLGTLTLLANLTIGTSLNWALGYCGAALVASLIQWQIWLRHTSRQLMTISPQASLLRGWPLALGTFLTRSTQEADRILLARLATIESVGLYGSAMRFVEVALLPAYAYIEGKVPDLFNHFRQHNHLRQRMLFYTLTGLVMYGLASAALLRMLDFLPLLAFGQNFQATGAILNHIALLVPLLIAAYFLRLMLHAQGAQHQALAIDLLVCMTCLLLNIWLIPSMDWRGAACAMACACVLQIVGSLIILLPASKTRCTGSPP